MNRTFSCDRTLFLGLAAALSLGSCMTGEGSYCTSMPVPPSRISLYPDSLVLVPFSQSSHTSRTGGDAVEYTRYFHLAVSRSQDYSAISHFDSSGLSLYADSARIPTPPFWLETGGMGHCSAYQGKERIDVEESSADTAFTLQVRKDGVAVRSWRVEYKFDSAHTPEFQTAPAAEGLGVSIGLKSGAEIRGLWFSGGLNPTELPFQRVGETIRAEIIFKNIDFPRVPRDSTPVDSAGYYVCARSESGYESVTVDGESFPAAAGFCWELAGESRTKVIEYAKRLCRVCK